MHPFSSPTLCFIRPSSLIASSPFSIFLFLLLLLPFLLYSSSFLSIPTPPPPRPLPRRPPTSPSFSYLLLSSYSFFLLLLAHIFSLELFLRLSSSRIPLPSFLIPLHRSAPPPPPPPGRKSATRGAEESQGNTSSGRLKDSREREAGVHCRAPSSSSF